MTDNKNILIVSSEISGLWVTYMGESMSICVLRYFLNRTDDNEVKTMVKHGLKLSEQRIETLTKIMKQENLTIPIGFNEQDVDINAPRLFTDTFYLHYLTYRARVGMYNFTKVLNHISRSDIRSFFSKCIQESMEFFNMLADLRLSKGIFIKAPRVEVPKEVSFIKSPSFLVDFFGEKRPLLNQEITHMFAIFLSNIVGKALITGFGQVAKRKHVAEYFFKGEELATIQISSIVNIHIEEAIPIPSPSDSFVTDSTISPFSDKLMMFHNTAMLSVAVSTIGMAIGESLRSDLHMMYIKFAGRILSYAKDGTDIMIAENWMEQPPQAIKHENLVKGK